MAKTGGHLGSSLGVVELTVALHHVFNTPVCWWWDFGLFSFSFLELIRSLISQFAIKLMLQDDKIIWDVGHQAYIHKILTGRRGKMSTIRTQGGLSGELLNLS